MAGTFRNPVTGNRTGRPWTTIEKAVAILLAVLVIVFGIMSTIVSNHHRQASNLEDLAMELSWVGMAGCVIYLSIKRPEIRRGFKVGRRR